MIRKIVIITALLLFWAHGKDYSPAKSQAAEPQTQSAASMPNDRYSSVEEESYAKARDDFLRASVITYFAAGCRVFAQPASLQRVSAMLIVGHEYARLQRDPKWANDRTLDRESQEANRAGLELASRPPKCKYWHENPQAVAAMRLADQIASQ